MTHEYDMKTFTLGRYGHINRNHGMCIMEATAYIAGEKHTDSPKCVHPYIAELCRRMNDIANNEERQYLRSYVWLVIGTNNVGLEIEAKLKNIFSRTICTVRNKFGLHYNLLAESNRLKCILAINVYRRAIDNMLNLIIPKEPSYDKRTRQSEITKDAQSLDQRFESKV